MRIDPFQIHVPDAVLDDLRARLGRTRWPDAIEGGGWSEGADLSFMKEIVEHWRARFDWREQERAFHTFAHFRAEIDSLGIHFLHERGKGPAPFPLVLTHGWPGSFVEMLAILPRLTDPARFGGDERDGFDVVVPSLPGFGFSDRPTRPGMSVWAIGDLWAELMTGLGYSRFGAQGGDFGAGVSTVLGLRHPERLAGIHLNYIPGGYRPYLAPGAELTEEELRFQREADDWFQAEGAYAHLHRTKPQTLAYGLHDSPAGLAAWLLEKFHGWSDCDGDLARRFSKDELLANVTLYWMTETLHSSIRLYVEGWKAPLHFRAGESVRVPCGIARFPREAPFPPRSWIERGYAVRHWTEMPRGGHFAAMEEPALLARDIQDFFRPLR
jgi:pimeloyl-ACP methyl ester carboxylesterase